MSLICRVVIGYFDADAACIQRTITPRKPLDGDQLARLQTYCELIFGIKVPLSGYLTATGLLSIEDVIVREETYRVACVAHELFGMSAIDSAHRTVIFPAEDSALPDQAELIEHYTTVCPEMDEQQRSQRVAEDLKWMKVENDFYCEVQSKVRAFGLWLRQNEKPTDFTV